MPATRSTSRNNLPGFQSRDDRWRQAKDGILRPNLEAEGDRLGVRWPCQVAPGCKDRWFIAGSRDGGLGWIVAMRQASLRATTPMMTILLHPPGSEGGCPIKWTVRRPAGEPGDVGPKTRQLVTRLAPRR